MHTLAKLIIFSVGLMLSVAAFAKGDGIGFNMEGTVTNVTADGDAIHFAFKGRFRIGQSRQNGAQHTDIVIECKPGTSITLKQHKEFFADYPTIAASALRGKGHLLQILEKAAESGTSVKMNVMHPTIVFGQGGSLTVLDGLVDHATDPDLH
jgi:hypothetical protein